MSEPASEVLAERVDSDGALSGRFKNGLRLSLINTMFSRMATFAVGVLLKGPLIAMVVGLTIVALVVVDRSCRWLWALKPLPGIAWLALLVLPWFLAIIGRSGETFFAESVGQDLASKLFAGQESHGAPPGSYFLLFWFTFWPGSTLAALAGIRRSG